MSRPVNETNVRQEAASLGLSLTLKNNGEHWIFREAAGVLCEWWPSTDRLVFKKTWKQPCWAATPKLLFQFIRRRLAPRMIVVTEPPAYLEYLKELVES